MPLVDTTHVKCGNPACGQTYAATFTKPDPTHPTTFNSSACPNCGSRETFFYNDHPYPEGSVGHQQTAIMAQMAAGLSVVKATGLTSTLTVKGRS